MKLFLKGEKCFVKCILEKRPVPPGPARSRRRRTKLSEYAVRLREKQKLRYMAGVLEGHFQRLVRRATRVPGQTGQALLRFLDCRLDQVVRRVGLATSPKAARQLIAHGHVSVNRRRVHSPSYEVRPGDVVGLSPSMRENAGVQLSLQMAEKRSGCPAWLAWDPKTLEAKVLRHPSREESAFPIDEHLIVEYYSKD